MSLATKGSRLGKRGRLPCADGGFKLKVCYAERDNKTASCNDITKRSLCNEIILRLQNSDITLQAT